MTRHRSDAPVGAGERGPVALGSGGRRLVDRVYEGILDAIREGRIRPGHRLVLHRLAGELGVSLSPVREAIARLAQDGLVDLQPHKGAVVTTLSTDEIDQIYDVREALEVFALTKAIERATPDDIAALESACRHVEEQREHLTIREWFEANREFHRLLVAPCGNRIILDVLDGLWDRQAAIAMLASYTADEAAVEQLIAEHRTLLDAFRFGRTELAQVLIQSHIRDGRRTLAGRSEGEDPSAQEVGSDA